MRRRCLSDRERELIERAHGEAMRRGACSYADPLSGQSVFTAAHHLKRGRCCRSCCRHCPYPKEARPKSPLEDAAAAAR